MKKIISILLVLALAFSLVACGGNGGGTNVGSGDQDANGNYTNRHVKPLYIENNIFDRARKGIFNISSPESNKANIILKNNQIFARSNTKIIGDLTIKDDYMSKLNQKYTMEGNTFTLVQ